MALKDFAKLLGQGLEAEDALVRWFNRNGYTVLHIKGDGEGPRVSSPSRPIVCPDLLVFKSGEVRWIEAKCKSAFTWYRNGERWVTGIDQKYWR